MNRSRGITDKLHVEWLAGLSARWIRAEWAEKVTDVDTVGDVSR
jgi:hypothetical protein